MIEQATIVDVAALVELMSEFYSESGHPLDLHWAAASFCHLFQDERRGAVWMARSADNAAGYIVLVFKHSMEYGGPTGIIDDLFVRAQCRRQGLGTALVSSAFQACRKLGVAAVEVEVGANNDAAGILYQTFGLCPKADNRRQLAVHLSKQTMLPNSSLERSRS